MEAKKVVSKTKKVAVKSKKKREATPFYDSDEEISWGKVSIKEVKAKLTGNQNFKPVERYSTSCLLESNIGISRMDLNETQENIEVSIPEVSQYLTASEQSNTEKNSTATADYLSAIEPNTSGKSSVYLSTFDDFEKYNDIEGEDTCLNFIQKALDVTIDNLENENQTLVEISVNYCNESTSSSSVILISSDDEDELEFPVNVDIKKDNLSYEVEVSDEKISSNSETDYSRGEETYDIPSFYIENRNINNFKTYTSQNESILTRNISPATSIPDISLQNFNDSTGSVLNNTLDKINAILAQEESASTTQSKSDSEEDNMSIDNKWFSEPKTMTCNIISASFLPISLSENYKTPEKSYRTPSIKVTPTITKSKPTTSKTNIPVFKKSPEFKKPQLPNKVKVPNKPKINIKDIVSPVRMYIKYSPKPVLKQSGLSVEKPLSKFNLSPRVFEGKNKENLNEIPNIRYKPSKKQILASEESIHFPESLDKMIKKSAVIKHEWHPRNKTNCQRNETLNPEAELTKSFLSDCSISEDNNISILHKRTALRD